MCWLIAKLAIRLLLRKSCTWTDKVGLGRVFNIVVMMTKMRVVILLSVKIVIGCQRPRILQRQQN